MAQWWFEARWCIGARGETNGTDPRMATITPPHIGQYRPSLFLPVLLFLSALSTALSRILSLSRILFPLCLARHVSRLDSGTFRCCVVTRVMHRNFKGPRHREISPPEYIRREGTMPRTKAICFLFPDRSPGPWWFVIAYEYIPTRFEGYRHRRRRVCIPGRACCGSFHAYECWKRFPYCWTLNTVEVMACTGPNETTARFARKFAKFKREPSWISMPNVGGKRSLESTRAAYEPCCKIPSTSGPLDSFFFFLSTATGYLYCRRENIKAVTFLKYLFVTSPYKHVY